ncbi:MAG: 30S ribosomal protein S1 [Candidatus Cloacimonetes bacterium]|nr:30S ribosomal protein S1 [Candidatus Cloacimonadota bacterium]
MPVIEPEPTTEADEAVSEPEPPALEELPVDEPLIEEELSIEPMPVIEPEPTTVDVATETPVEKPAPKPKKRTLSPEEKHREDMLSMYEESFSNFQKGQIVKGKVVDITEKEVMVDIGFKSEGIIPIAEFANTGIPQKNTEINVFINQTEDGEGKLSLSKRKADFILNIQRIKECYASGDPISGVIRRRVKGGMIVDLMGIEAFLPGSQMSIKPIPNLDQFIGKEMNFKVVGIEEEHRNIILSRKQVMEAEYAAKKHELLERIEIGAELDGEVKNITTYGAFIDLGGIDGLLHLTDMSWGKIEHPSEMLNIGDKIKVKVIGFDPESQKISLGLRQLVPHPWEHIEIKYPEGTRVTGKVVSIKSFGAFIEIEPGVEGLVHISEMSWTKKISDARKFLKGGDTVNAIVLEINKDNRRISLGMKQMDPNPWLTIEDRYPIGLVLNRKIKSLTNFGAFIEIEEGIDGLIHLSDISWTKRIYHPREFFRKSQEMEVVVLSIDRAMHRIALGVKQLTPDPWENLDKVIPVNTEVKGKISKLIPKGVLVDIPIENDVVEGFVPISHLALPKLEHSEDAFHMEEELPLKVIELDMENRRLILSVKAFFFSRDPRLQEEYIAIHEQFMRDRITQIQKKKVEKDAREKAAREKAERDAKEKAERDAREKAERIAREQAEQEAKLAAEAETTAELQPLTAEPLEHPTEPISPEVVAEETVPAEEPTEAEIIPVMETEVPEAPVEAEPETLELPAAEPITEEEIKPVIDAEEETPAPEEPEAIEEIKPVIDAEEETPAPEEPTEPEPEGKE